MHYLLVSIYQIYRYRARKEILQKGHLIEGRHFIFSQHVVDQNFSRYLLSPFTYCVGQLAHVFDALAFYVATGLGW